MIDQLIHHWQTIWQGALLVVLLYILGVLHVAHALMSGRTSQGTIAWVIALVAMPLIAVPAYWVIGRWKFKGYVEGRRAKEAAFRKISVEMHDALKSYEVDVPEDAFENAAKVLSGLPFTTGNKLDLLVDGEETFEKVFAAIRSARHYLCVCFFIVKNDRVGTKFLEALAERARAGVRVRFLYDEIGSHKLPGKALRALKQAGVECHHFGANRMWWSRLQINFRNHRKIVVADGEVALFGGLNVGDEYMGQSKQFGKWRDTHLQVRGPVVQAVQLVFLRDWYWATGDVPECLKWTTMPHEANQIAAVIPTGPADALDSWQLLVAEAANLSRKRLWIASPYFVPDEGVLTALLLASTRGVDVRILIPEKADHLPVWLAAFTYFEQTIPYGIRLFRYDDGFLHQKVMLVDERMATVGSANLDNRSFRLNFEITGFSTDPIFIAEMREMLEGDFARAREIGVEDFTDRSFLFRLAARAARLAAPLL